MEQVTKIKSILETFFFTDIDLNDWKFVGALGYVNMNDKVNLCPKCKPFVVKATEIDELFNKIDADIPIEVNDRDESYKLMILNILFTIFANPGPILRSKIDEETFEKIQKKQGNWVNVLFWTPNQYDLVQLDGNKKPKYKNVLFTSSYSTGKTEVIKGMMRKLLENKQKCHFVICNPVRVRKPILLLQIENEFDDNKYKEFIKFSVLQPLQQDQPLSRIFKQLADLIAEYPGYNTFVDEFVMKMKTDEEDCSRHVKHLKTLTKVKLLRS